MYGFEHIPSLTFEYLIRLTNEIHEEQKIPCKILCFHNRHYLNVYINNKQQNTTINYINVLSILIQPKNSNCTNPTNHIYVISFNTKTKGSVKYTTFKVILCASEHICSIVQYCFRSFKQL